MWTASHRQFRSGNLYTLNQMIELTNVAVLLVGTNNRVIDFNQEGKQLLNKSVSQPKEKYFHEIVDLYSGELDLSGDAENSTQHITLICDGKPRTFKANISPIKNWRGQTTNKILVLSDITEYELRSQETSALLDISTAVSSSLNFQDVLLIMTERLLTLTNFNLCEIYEWDEERDQLFLLIEHGHAFWPENGSDIYSLDEWPKEQAVLQSGVPSLETYDEDDPEGEGYANSWLIPIKANDQVIGLMEVAYVTEISSNPDDILSICHSLLSEASMWFKSFENLVEEKVLELAEQVVKHTHANDCAISKWNRSDNTVETVASVTHSSWERFQGLKYTADIWPSATKALHDGQWSVIRRDDQEINPAELEDLYEWNAQISVVMPISIKGQVLGLVEICKLSMMVLSQMRRCNFGNTPPIRLPSLLKTLVYSTKPNAH